MAHIKVMEQSQRVTAPVHGATVLLTVAAACLPQTVAAQVSNTIVVSQAPQSSPAFRRSIAWGALKGRLLRWQNLPDDWDGDGGAAPSRLVLDNAKSFIELAQKAGAPVPAPFISGDGEIGFRWAKGNHFASVSFVEGDIIAYLRSDQGEAELDQAFIDTSPDVKGLVSGLLAFA